MPNGVESSGVPTGAAAAPALCAVVSTPGAGAPAWGVAYALLATADELADAWDEPGGRLPKRILAGSAPSTHQRRASGEEWLCDISS